MQKGLPVTHWAFTEVNSIPRKLPRNFYSLHERTPLSATYKTTSATRRFIFRLYQSSFFNILNILQQILQTKHRNSCKYVCSLKQVQYYKIRNVGKMLRRLFVLRRAKNLVKSIFCWDPVELSVLLYR